MTSDLDVGALTGAGLVLGGPLVVTVGGGVRALLPLAQTQHLAPPALRQLVFPLQLVELPALRQPLPALPPPHRPAATGGRRRLQQAVGLQELLGQSEKSEKSEKSE